MKPHYHYTKPQLRALLKVYNRDRNVSPSYRTFRRSAFPAFRDCLMIQWKGMTLGIEIDGHCHS